MPRKTIMPKMQHMSDTTNKETEIFLKGLRWGQLSGELVMDIGCGLRNKSTEVILQCFPKVGKIIAIDKERLWKKATDNFFKNVEFLQANIMSRKGMKKLKDWKGQVSKLVCAHCISFMTKPERAFQHKIQLLKPGGQSGLLFVAKSECDDVYMEMAKKPKWSEYLKNLNTEEVMKLRESDPTYYFKMFEDIGFNVVFCHQQAVEYIYYDDDEFEDGVWYSSFIESIPEELQEEFVADTKSTFLSIHPRNACGNLNYKYFVIKALVKKTHEEEMA